ncbi:hypothetical protein OC842_005376 [Tilletia horrida]|uniref:Uncharacterized protein n=1 Tax=Tilletia horrida TaxID=155126 RepID=A0AAN6G824_9BASI|nr:hypothetical protein OC842_005376 [Tilletia horrida]
MALPGELLVHILRFAIAPDKHHEADVKRYIRRAAGLKLVCSKFKAAVSMVLHQHMHTFHVDKNLPAERAPWHVGSRYLTCGIQGYWKKINGPAWSNLPDLAAVSKAVGFIRTPTIRTLSLDLRRQPSSIEHGEVPAPGCSVLGRTIVNSVLTRLLMAGPNLQELNLRISPDQDTVSLVEHIVRNTPHLRSLQLEIDANGYCSAGHTVVKLQNMVKTGVTYSSLECFVLRCPGVTVQCFDGHSGSPSFVDRLPYVNCFGLFATRLDVGTQPLDWLAKVLRHTPHLGACHFSVDTDTADPLSSGAKRYAPMRLPHLTDLVLEESNVDTSFLRSFDAPHLSAVRIRSRVRVETWPICSRNHFPALSFVNIWCPGVAAKRLTALGVPRWRFDYEPNLDDWHNDYNYHHQEFPAVILPFGRTRPQTRIPDTCTPTKRESNESNTEGPDLKRQRASSS